VVALAAVGLRVNANNKNIVIVVPMDHLRPVP
jgi:hypothetical protein